MTPIEKSKLIDELFSLRKADQELMESDRKRLDDLVDSFQAANVELCGLRVQLSDLLKQLAAKDAENVSLREELKLSRKNLYGKKSQRGYSSKKKDSVSREESKDDFDDTSGSLPCCGDELSPSVEAGSASGASPKVVRLYRLGMDYRRMGADKSVLHCSDRSRVPAGARIIKVFSRYAYEQVSELVEHGYQVVRYKMSDGHIYEAYLPASGEPEVIDIVPGTHASSNLLAYLAFNRFVLDTPLYRESYRILDEKMRVSRMTLTYWLAKGSVFVSRLVDVLMEKALRYLHTFWKQLFVYLNDGRYSIDNSLAERFIRPLAGERKNSLFFGSNWRTAVSAAYHTIISTCRLHGISALEFLKKFFGAIVWMSHGDTITAIPFLKKFFGAIVSGRRDYENLLPMTIGIKPNKI